MTPPRVDAYRIRARKGAVNIRRGAPPHYSRYFAGSDLLVVDTRSNRIVSVIPNIF